MFTQLMNTSMIRALTHLRQNGQLMKIIVIKGCGYDRNTLKQVPIFISGSSPNGIIPTFSYY